LAHFSRFGNLYRENSGNPAPESRDQASAPRYRLCLGNTGLRVRIPPGVDFSYNFD
jgi:hypothetical protein